MQIKLLVANAPFTRTLGTERSLRMEQLLLIGDACTVYAPKLLEKRQVLLCGIVLRLEAQHHADLLRTQLPVVHHFALGVVTPVDPIDCQVRESFV